MACPTSSAARADREPARQRRRELAGSVASNSFSLGAVLAAVGLAFAASASGGLTSPAGLNALSVAFGFAVLPVLVGAIAKMVEGSHRHRYQYRSRNRR